MTKAENDEHEELRYKRCKTDEVADDGLENALDEMGEMGWWLWMIFILASSPGILNVWHLTSYVFIGSDLPHWCNIEQLHSTNWTQDEIRTIVSGNSSKSSCSALNWNYTQLAQLSYEEAFALTNSSAPPGSFECEAFSYIGSSVMSEWDLVCKKTALRTNVQMAVALGKFIGALIFGFVADKWGRKRAFVVSCVTYIAAGLISSFTGSYIVFVLTRIALGMAGSGTYNCAFTLLTEVCNSKHRTLLGNLYNIPYPIGMIILPVISYYLANDWQLLQLVLCAPSLLLIVNCIFLPESPRWLISQGRRDEAWDVVKKATGGRRTPNVDLSLAAAAEAEKILKDAQDAPKVEAPSISITQRFVESMSKMTSLFQTAEMRWRTLICYFGWCVIALTYFALTLSSDNFSSNKYYYIAIAGAVEAVSYVLPVPILKVIGRRLCCGILLFVSAAALLSILMIPKDSPVVIMSVAMIGRLSIGSVYSVIILYTSELFPTENRNSAVGTCSTISNVGSISAPYVVDLLGAVAWFIPSTLCGILSLLAGLLILLLPETKDKALCDTVQDVLEKDGDRTTIKNFCVCK